MFSLALIRSDVIRCEFSSKQFSLVDCITALINLFFICAGHCSSRI